MAGLMNQPAGAGGAPTAAPEDEAQANVSPEEQQQYEDFVDTAKQLIYNEQFLPSLLDRLSAGQGDESGMGGTMDDIAQAAVLIVQRVQEAAQQAGQQIGEAVLYQAGVDVVELLGELVEAAGIAEVDEQMLEGAFYRALDLWREGSGIDQTQLKQEFAQLQEADANGQLGAILPGIQAGEAR